MAGMPGPTAAAMRSTTSFGSPISPSLRSVTRWTPHPSASSGTMTPATAPSVSSRLVPLVMTSVTRSSRSPAPLLQPLVLDVGAHAHPFRHPSLLDDRNGADSVVAVAVVDRAQTVDALPHLGDLVHGTRPGLRCRFAVLGVQRPQPSLAAVLLPGLTGHPRPFAAGLDHLAVGRSHPDDLRTQLDQALVTEQDVAALIGEGLDPLRGTDLVGDVQNMARTPRAPP